MNYGADMVEEALLSWWRLLRGPYTEVERQAAEGAPMSRSASARPMRPASRPNPRTADAAFANYLPKLDEPYSG